MAFDWNRDWSLAAAGLAGAAGIALYVTGRRTEQVNIPVQVGADAGSYAAAVQGATQVELARQQTAGQVAVAYLGFQSERERAASAERVSLAQLSVAEQIAAEQAAASRAQTEAQLAAVRGQQAAQSQGNVFSFIMSALSFLPKLFSVERTAEAENRFVRGRRRLNVIYQGTYTGLQTPVAGNVPGVDYPAQAAA